MTVRTADARKNPHLVVRDPHGNITKVINVGDLQVGFPGDEASLILTGGLEVATRIVKLNAANTTYNLALEDLVVCVNSPTTQTNIILPTIPISGKLYIIKDIAGTAQTYPISLIPAKGILIDGNASAVINDNYGSFFIIWNGTGWVTIARGGTGGIFAPSNASYITVAAESGLSNERRAVSNSGTITLVDGGANTQISIDLSTTGVAPGVYTAANVTVDAYGRVTGISNGAVPSAAASYVTINNESSLSAERALVPGTGIGLTDNGPNTNVVLFIKDNIVASLTGAKFTGPLYASNGLTGSLQQVGAGFPYLLSGPGITISTGALGQITIGSLSTVTTVTGTWRDAGNAFVTTGSVSIDSKNRTARQIGADVYFFVSGSQGVLSGPNRQISVFGGDTVFSGSVNVVTATGASGSINFDGKVLFTTTGLTASGSLIAQTGLSGSLTKLADGVTSYLVGGTNITIASQSNGQVVISAAATPPIAGEGVSVNGTTTSLNLAAGTGVSIVSGSGTQVVISAAATPPVAGEGVSVNGATTSLNLAAGTGVSIVSGSGTQVVISAAAGAPVAGEGVSVNGTATSLNLAAGAGVSIVSGSGTQVVISATGGGGGTGGTTFTAGPRYTAIDSSTLICWTLDEVSPPYANTGAAGTLALATNIGSPKSAQGLFGRAAGMNYDVVLSTGNSSVGEVTGQALTVTAWVKMKSYPSQTATVLSKAYRNDNTWTAPYNVISLSVNPNGTLSTYVTTAGVQNTLVSSDLVDFVPLNEWTLLSLTYDGTFLRGYINGIQVSSMAVTGNLDYGTHGPWDVAGLSPAPVNAVARMDGIIDDIRVENAVRSQTYLSLMYKNGMGLSDGASSSNSIVITGSYVPADEFDYLWWPCHDTTGPYLLNYGTAGALGHMTQSSTTVRYNQPGAIGTSVAPNTNGATNNYWTILNTATQPQPSGTNVTISAWFRPENPTSNTHQKIVHKSYYNTISSWTAPYETLSMAHDAGSNGGIEFTVTVGGASQNLNPAASASMSANQWQHMGITYDGANIRTYLNGVLLNVYPQTGSIDYSQNGWWAIGGNPAIPGEYFQGQIEDVRVANTTRPLSWFQRVWQSGRPAGFLVISSSVATSVVTNVISSSAAGQSAYQGYTTASIAWTATGSWTPFTGSLLNGTFVDVVSQYVTRNGSSFTFTNGGLYYFHAGFNAYGSDAYISLRLNGGVQGIGLARTTYRTTPADQNLVVLDGVFSASIGDVWTLEYVTSGSAYAWTGSNPTPDGTNMRTGEISMFLISSPTAGAAKAPLYSLPILAGTVVSNTSFPASKQSLGMVFFNPAMVQGFGGSSRKYYFRAILDCLTTDLNLSASVDLNDYNGIVAFPPSSIPGSIMSTSSPSTVQLQADLTNVLQAVSGSGLFEARLWRTVSGSLSSAVTCRGARLDVEFS